MPITQVKNLNKKRVCDISDDRKSMKMPGLVYQ